MRRRIRLTGRKQIPYSYVQVRMFYPEEGSGRRVILLKILNLEWLLQSFPVGSKLKLRLIEHRFVETVTLGVLNAEESLYVKDLRHTAFAAPTCQLRVVVPDGDSQGKLLGSTKTWTLRDDEGPNQGKRKGILLFQPSDIAPRIWKLHVQDDDYPIVYIDEKIENARVWACSDPVFTSCVLPTIIREVFKDIFLNLDDDSDIGWARDWMGWARALMPGESHPAPDDTDQDKWIENLQDSFCRKHNMLGQLLEGMKK